VWGSEFTTKVAPTGGIEQNFQLQGEFDPSKTNLTSQKCSFTSPPPELRHISAWLRPTHHALFTRASLFGRLERALTKYTITRISNSGIISPTHKRTEGRAPVLGSEFTTKVAHYEGGHQKTLLVG
jgi:hypothetical protein